MTTPSWPSVVLGSAVLRDGFRYQRRPAIERTEMDSGLARGRLYNTNPLARVPCQLPPWSEFQNQFFEAWLQTVADRGGTWFNIDLPLEGVTYRTVLARVVGEPSRTPSTADGMMITQIEFEVHDALVLPDGIVEVILEFGADGVGDIDAALADITLQPFFDAWAAAAEA